MKLYAAVALCLVCAGCTLYPDPPADLNDCKAWHRKVYECDPLLGDCRDAMRRELERCNAEHGELTMCRLQADELYTLRNELRALRAAIATSATMTTQHRESAKP